MAKADVHMDKDELKRPDVFLQTMEKSLTAFDRHRSLITGALAVLIVAAIGYLVWNYVQGSAERKAASDLYVTEAQYFKIKEGFDKAKYEALAPPPAGEKTEDKKDKATPSTGDLQKDYGAVLPGFEEVIQKHAKTAAGAQAALWLAEIYLEYKQPEKAAEALAKVAPQQKTDSMLFGATHMLYGTALASKGDCTQAVGSWQKVLESEGNAFLHPEALLKSGVCYENLQQNDKATEMYRRVTENHSETSAAQSAKTYLRALEMKSAAAPAAKAG
ncbi:MAG: tetratricopeptide repeat protein [Bdellovibrionaceae bacterium]|nr:tetratricopeptide repeat protein [Pseudobdellovibrionaceae bacterium]